MIDHYNQKTVYWLIYLLKSEDEVIRYEYLSMNGIDIDLFIDDDQVDWDGVFEQIKQVSKDANEN